MRILTISLCAALALSMSATAGATDFGVLFSNQGHPALADELGLDDLGLGDALSGIEPAAGDDIEVEKLDAPEAGDDAGVPEALEETLGSEKGTFDFPTFDQQ